MQGDLYFDGVHETDRGIFAVIMSTATDGNFADVYGETAEDAEKNARELIALANIGEHYHERAQSVAKLTARFVLFRDSQMAAFETAHEAAIFLWGREVEKWNVLKDGVPVYLPTLKISEIERILEQD